MKSMEDIEKKLNNWREGYLDIVLQLNRIAKKEVQDENRALQQSEFLNLVVRANQAVKDILY